jgi:O-methyltransferase involved in polyketide biosynthesis
MILSMLRLRRQRHGEKHQRKQNHAPERQASNTAIIPAVLRAAHQFLDADPKILDDPVAIGLVEGSSEAEIRAQASDLQQPLKRLARSLFVMRSRFAEDQLAEAVKAGMRHNTSSSG